MDDRKVKVDDKKEDASVFDLIEGFTPVDPGALADFKQTMNQEVIPEIVRVVEERRLLAAESRHWQLKC
jgi:hypothetical protein